jgi:hypothetical protein
VIAAESAFIDDSTIIAACMVTYRCVWTVVNCCVCITFMALACLIVIWVGGDNSPRRSQGKSECSLINQDYSLTYHVDDTMGFCAKK